MTFQIKTMLSTILDLGDSAERLVWIELQKLHMMKYLKNVCWLAASLAVLGVPVSAKDAAANSKILNIADKSVKKTEVRHSMLGARDTVIFYQFGKQQAVLVVNLKHQVNQPNQFSVTAKVHIFANGVAGEALEKWVNNQHSDGLYPDVPRPAASYPIPEKFCQVVASKLLERIKAHNGEHDDYSVQFKIGEVTEKDVFVLKSVTETSKAFVKPSKG